MEPTCTRPEAVFSSRIMSLPFSFNAPARAASAPATMSSAQNIVELYPYKKFVAIARANLSFLRTCTGQGKGCPPLSLPSTAAAEARAEQEESPALAGLIRVPQKRKESGFYSTETMEYCIFPLGVEKVNASPFFFPMRASPSGEM